MIKTKFCRDIVSLILRINKTKTRCIIWKKFYYTYIKINELYCLFTVQKSLREIRSLKCKLIEFTVPNLNLNFYLSETSIKKRFLLQNNIVNVCVLWIHKCYFVLELKGIRCWYRSFLINNYFGMHILCEFFKFSFPFIYNKLIPYITQITLIK